MTKEIFLQHRTFNSLGAVGIIGFHTDDFVAEPHFTTFDFKA